MVKWKLNSIAYINIIKLQTLCNNLLHIYPKIMCAIYLKFDIFNEFMHFYASILKVSSLRLSQKCKLITKTIYLNLYKNKHVIIKSSF